MKKIIIFLFVLNINVLLSQEKTNFNKFLSNFEIIQADTISKADVWRPKLHIDKESVISFVTTENDCKCEEGMLWFRYEKMIEYDKYFIAFISKDCDTPRKGYYPYNENMLFVYTKEGNIIDNKIISRYGDFWEYNLKGTRKPFELEVEQAYVPKEYWKSNTGYPVPCKIKTYIYSITEEGRIKQKLLSKEKGNIEWDVDNQKSFIVRNKSN